jgi:nicotinamide phosphoribosyltransferase
MNPRNLILATDSYKASHWKQYPSGTESMFSYIEARNTLSPNNYTVFFGLQAILNEYLRKPITISDIIEAEELFAAHGEPFNVDGWMHIYHEHGGYMPVRIQAVSEGSTVPNGNVLVTVESTDQKVPWLASYLETLLLRVWYPTSVATRSHQCKKVIKSFLEATGDVAGLSFKLHDFGARGVSSGESAMLGGMGHLVNFMGTDTVEALVGARRYYGAHMAGLSIPAAEHSTITSWGKDHEVDAYRNMLKQYAKPGSILAVVSDSYDLKHAVLDLWGGELRQEVIESGATVVIRPDSGDPVTNVSAVARALDEKFGSTVNAKGFKVLNNVRIIQGDGIDGPLAINSILGFLTSNGFSADNVAFGMGGGLLQHVNRDTFGFAMKCSAIKVNGEWRDVFKESPGKGSKKGRLQLIRGESGIETVPANAPWRDHGVGLLHTVYHNGDFAPDQTLDEIRILASE